MCDKKTALQIPHILLPGDGVNMYKWAVVACDQYTSEPDYWEKVRDIIRSDPSTYNLMLPEIYLEDSDADQKIAKINETMRSYIDNGTLIESDPQFILVERETGCSPMRTGLIVALDLEEYDYNKGSGSLIRATEGTVTERIPPRMKIRKNAVLEMPHVMILIDDPGCTVIEPIAAQIHSPDSVPLYDFDLMQGGGHIRGFAVSSASMQQHIQDALAALGEEETFYQKYDVPAGTPVLLYAVGDGNHSLASAKCHYEELKKRGVDASASRYALVELVNVHDQGIIFEPIHRVIFNVDSDDFLDGLSEYYKDKVSYTQLDMQTDLSEHDLPEYPGAFTIRYETCDRQGYIYIDRSVHTLAVGALQNYIDFYLESCCQGTRGDIRIDYIHGAQAVQKLAAKPGNLGLILPGMQKNELFASVIKNGVLPRKTFSMGEASEKRYYLECRRISDK